MENIARDKLNHRVVHDLINRSAAGIPFYILLYLLVVIPDGFYKRHPGFALFFGLLIFGFCLLRYLHLLVSKWMSDAIKSMNHVIFCVGAGITGLTWGIFFACLMVQDGEHTAKLLVTICSAGLSAGGIVAFIPDLRLSIFYNVAMLAPAITLMFFRGINFPVAAAFLMYSAYMIFMAHRGNRDYWRALENECLLLKKTDQLNLLSRIDSLTGLYNRRHFDECLDQEYKKGSRIQHPPTVIIADIDYFKQINDQHGHQAGDDFLRLTAILLRRVFKRSTDIVARFGGEEFIVMLSDGPPQTAFELAEELRRRMAAMRMPYNGVEVSATISIGIASAAYGFEESQDALIARADEALYQAKSQGRNRTIAASPLHSLAMQPA